MNDLRYLVIFAGIALTVTSCRSLRSTTKTRPDDARTNANVYGQAPKNNAEKESLPLFPEAVRAPKIVIIPSFQIEAGLPIQFKYAIRMDVEVERLANDALYSFIENWWGTPYRFGGSTQRGVDCSSFTQTLLSAIYDVNVPRTAHEQKLYCNPVQPEELKEGDLVFFITKGRNISHVGLYLQDNKFVHASTSSGVVISSLNENYWSKRYAGAGRVIEEKTGGPASARYP